jgi:hypothetical protein
LGALQQKALALEAQQIGNQPAFLGLLGSLHRLIELDRSRQDLAGVAQDFYHQQDNERQA